MTRLVLRELVARPLRTALTALAIVLGVAMISAALTVGDTMSRGADSLTNASYAGTDAVVTTKAAFKAELVQDLRTPVPASTLAAVRNVPEVGVAAGDVLDEAKVIDRAGKVVGQGPYLGVGFDAGTPGAEKVSPFRLARGRWAAGAGEVVLDQGTAQKQGYGLGDDIRIAARGPAADYELVGITRFGSVKSLGTASVAVFDLRTAQAAFDRGDGYDSILVAGHGAPAADVRAAVARAVPSLQVQGPETQDRFALDGLKSFVGIIQTVLLVFGGVAVLVGAFTIVNTLSITVAQRSRELALLRALGAHRRQVRRSVVGEALLIGAGSSAIGVVAGYGLAGGITALFEKTGLALPQADAAFSATTLVVGLAVGTVVTVLASLRPARRATRVAPVSILREGAADAGAPGRLGRGVRALVGVVGRPAQAAGGTAGKLARMNAMRAPGRTMATASALTIGVSLVVAVAVIGHGLKSSAMDSEQDRIAADYVLSGADGWSPVDSAAVEAVGGVPGVETVSAVRKDEAKAFGDRATVAGIDPRTLPKVLHYHWKAGSTAVFSSLGDDGAVVGSDFAKQNRLAIGSPFSVTSRSGEKLSLVVRAIERKPRTDVLGLGEVLVAGRAFDRVFEADRAALTLVNVGGGHSARAEKTLAASIGRFPDAKIMTPTEYVEVNSGFIDDLLAVFYVLLALAVIVSLFGIVNTLVLSIFERTRELGMLRAIGMTRRQVRRMIRHESIITATLGASAGIVIGLGLAAVVTTVFADEGFAFVVPAWSLVTFLAVAVGAGILAAAVPARRASRLDPLGALAYE